MIIFLQRFIKTLIFVSEYLLSLVMKIEITQRQEEIIEAAAKILIQSGVGGLTIKNIAKAMQFSESAIYRHFQSKEDIIVAMLEFVLNRLDVKSFAGLHSNTASKVLQAIFNVHFSYFKEHPYLAIAIFSDGLLEESDRINDKISALMYSRKLILEPITKKGQDSGELTSTILAEDMVHILMGSVRLLIYQWRMSHFEFDIQERGNHLIDSILKVLKA